VSAREAVTLWAGSDPELQEAQDTAIDDWARGHAQFEREAWLRATLSSVAEAVVVTDVRGRVLMMNHAAQTLTGWTLTWTFANGQTIQQLWNAAFTQTGGNITVAQAYLAHLRAP